MGLVTCKLSDLITITNGKSVSSSSGQYPIYGGNGILGYADSFNCEDCIVIGRVGAFCGSVYYVDQKCWVSDNALIVKSKKEYCQRFIYYLLSILHLNDYKVGSSQPLITKGILNSIEVTIPQSKDDQLKIAHLLHNIDTEISVLQLLNEKLFANLRTVIDTYFCYLPEDVPDGWKLFLLRELATIISGYSYKGSDLVEKSRDALVTIKNFDRNGGFKTDGYKPLVITSRIKESQIIDLFDILIAHTDLTQGAEIIGNAEIVLSKGNYDKLVASMDLVKIEPNETIGRYLLAALLSGNLFKSHCLGYINGTTVLHLSKDATKDYSMALPDDSEVLKKYDDYCKSIYHFVSQNMAKKEQLISLKDCLLPKLMSGEIDVSTLDTTY